MIISTHPNAKWATYPLFILTSKKPVYKYADYTLPSQALSITPNTNYTNHDFFGFTLGHMVHPLLFREEQKPKQALEAGKQRFMSREF